MNTTNPVETRLTRYSHGAGCACKLGPEDLASALQALGRVAPDVEDVLVGLDAPDDAAVYALGDGRALVSSLDFFTPIVDDPYSFGAIAAANALSDIYAMGGRPLFALNIVAFPIEELGHEILARILEGGRDKAAQVDVPVIGGHSIDDPEPKYGLVVLGMVDVDRIYRKSDGRAGDRLVLSKALGTGVITTAIKRERASDSSAEAAIDSMLRVNAPALEVAASHDIGAMTDVTGYGLLGHVAELARSSGLGAVIEADAVPLLPGALDLCRAGCVPGGTRRNRAAIEAVTRWPDELEDARRDMLCDAQTSGGLLMTVAAAAAADVVAALRGRGFTAADVGSLVADGPGTIVVT